MIRCALCHKPIDNHSPAFHQLQIDNHTVDLCQQCIDAIVEWQNNKYAKLFPTKALKKMYNKQG